MFTLDGVVGFLFFYHGIGRMSEPAERTIQLDIPTPFEEQLTQPRNDSSPTVPLGDTAVAPAKPSAQSLPFPLCKCCAFHTFVLFRM